MKQIIRKHLNENRRKYLVLTMLAGFGVLAGLLTAGMLGESTTALLALEIKGYLSGAIDSSPDRVKLLRAALYGELKWFLALFILGLSTLGAIYSLCYCAFRGYAVGFACGVLVRLYGGNGAALALSAVVLRALPAALTLVFSCALALSMSLKRSAAPKGLGRKSVSVSYYALYFVLMVLAFIPSMVGIYAETHIGIKYILILAPKMI